VRDGAHSREHGPLALNDALRPLLDLIDRTFVPLMAQNEAAYDCRACGRRESGSTNARSTAVAPSNDGVLLWPALPRGREDVPGARLA
jgi:hypothetical protein